MNVTVDTEERAFQRPGQAGAPCRFRSLAREPGTQTDALQFSLTSSRCDPAGWTAWHTVATCWNPYP